MWLSYWKLARDPFSAPCASYVATPTHDEAVARIVHAIESGQRSATLRAGAGLGKSTILARVLADTRSPSRRIARAAGPVDGPSLYAALADSLGTRVSPGAPRAAAWRTLTQAVRLERWQRTHVVLAIDDVHLLREPADLADLERLLHLDPAPTARFTVVTAGRPDDECAPPAPAWDVTLRLPPLARGEAEQFVLAKLASAGRTEATFTQRAITRLHAHSEGIPRGLDRLSALALMAGAVRGLEIITPEVIEGVTRECVLPAA
ncbi:MAG: type II secretory pathway protein ExeA [Isosphaeraceae bacterium]|nr:type II secretory pathway protein ExeA [Isosphaeraceae bacterium]